MEPDYGFPVASVTRYGVESYFHYMQASGRNRGLDWQDCQTQPVGEHQRDGSCSGALPNFRMSHVMSRRWMKRPRGGAKREIARKIFASGVTAIIGLSRSTAVTIARATFSGG
jgi:hypothetical protein